MVWCRATMEHQMRSPPATLSRDLRFEPFPLVPAETLAHTAQYQLMAVRGFVHQHTPPKFAKRSILKHIVRCLDVHCWIDDARKRTVVVELSEDGCVRSHTTWTLVLKIGSDNSVCFRDLGWEDTQDD